MTVYVCDEISTGVVYNEKKFSQSFLFDSFLDEINSVSENSAGPLLLSEGVLSNTTSLYSSFSVTQIGIFNSTANFSKSNIADFTSTGIFSSKYNSKSILDIVSSIASINSTSNELTIDIDDTDWFIYHGEYIQFRNIITSDYSLRIPIVYDTESLLNSKSTSKIFHIVDIEASTLNLITNYITKQNKVSLDVLANLVNTNEYTNKIIINKLITETSILSSSTNLANIFTTDYLSSALITSISPLDKSDITGVVSGGAYILSGTKNALSVYENFPVKETAMIGNKLFGITNDGLVIIDADKDKNNQDINARIRTGIFDFFSSQRKRIQDMFIYGQINDSEVEVNTVEPTSYTYVVDSKSGRSQCSRCVIGKGLSSVYWEFIIKNKNGDDFKIRMIELITKNSDRRL